MSRRVPRDQLQRLRGAPLIDRLEFRTVRRPNGCWIWTGALADGYGHIRVGDSGKLVHRVGYELLVGPIPAGKVLDHLCRNRACWNPDHLEPVTGQINTLRSPIAIAAICARKTHCPQGHPYDEANTIILKNGYRRCRTCKRAERSRR